MADKHDLDSRRKHLDDEIETISATIAAQRAEVDEVGVAVRKAAAEATGADELGLIPLDPGHLANNPDVKSMVESEAFRRYQSLLYQQIERARVTPPPSPSGEEAAAAEAEGAERPAEEEEKMDESGGGGEKHKAEDKVIDPTELLADLAEAEQNGEWNDDPAARQAFMERILAKQSSAKVPRRV